MIEEKITKPDVVLQLTAEQIAIIEPLLQKRRHENGLIIGSVGLSAKTVSLKYVERVVGVEIYNLAYQKIQIAEEITNVNS